MHSTFLFFSLHQVNMIAKKKLRVSANFSDYAVLSFLRADIPFIVATAPECSADSSQEQ